MLLMLLPETPAQAVGRYDDLTGINQSYTIGYDSRTYTSQAHDDAVYELTVPAEEKERQEEQREKEFEAKKDRWTYVRDATHSTTYVSNIAGSRTDPRDDLIHNEKLQLGAIRNAEKNFVELFYNASYTHQTEDEKASELQHQQLTRFGYNLGRLKLILSNTFSPGEVFQTGERSELDSGNRGGRATSVSNNTRLELTFRQSPKTRWASSYDHNVNYLPVSENSLTVNSFSTITHVLSQSVFYQWTAKTQLRSSYSWTFVDYYRGNIFESTTHKIDVGARTRLGAKTFVDGSLGWYVRSYEDLDVDSRQGPQWNLALSRQLTQKIALTLTAQYSETEQIAGVTRIREGTAYGADLSWKLHPRLTWAVGGDMLFNSTGDQAEKVDPENSSLRFLRPEESDGYEWFSELRFTPKRAVTALLGYSYLNQNASFKNDEFQDHRLVGSMNSRF